MEKWYLLVLLIRISLVWNDLEHLFLRLLVKIVKVLISQIVGQVRQLCKYKGKEWGKVQGRFYSTNTYCALNNN